MERLIGKPDVSQELRSLRADVVAIIGRIDRLTRLTQSGGENRAAVAGQFISLSLPGQPNVRFDTTSGEVISDSGVVTLFGPNESRMFLALLNRPNEVLDRDTLASACWSEIYLRDNYGYKAYMDHAINSTVRRIRKRLEAVSPDYRNRLQTIPGKGYRWSDPGKLDKKPQL